MIRIPGGGCADMPVNQTAGVQIVQHPDDQPNRPPDTPGYEISGPPLTAGQDAQHIRREPVPINSGGTGLIP